MKRQQKPKRPTGRNFAGGQRPILCMADAKITVAVNPLSEEDDGSLELTLEAESGSYDRGIEISYRANQGSEAKTMKLDAAHAAHLPELYRALMARSPLLNPIVAVR